MAGLNAKPGEIIDVRPLGAAAATRDTQVLAKTDDMELVRLVLPQGKELPKHWTHGQMVLQCLEGQVVFTAMDRDVELGPGRLLYLDRDEPHAVKALQDSSLLLTVLLPPKT